MATVGRPRSSCMKCQLDKKKCSPIMQPGGTCTSCHRCEGKGTNCSFGQIICQTYVDVASKEPPEELSKKPSYHSGSTARPSVHPEKRRRIMESCNGIDAADVSGRATHLPSFSLSCVDEVKEEEADRCGRATPLPSEFSSAEDEFNLVDELEDGDAEGSGRATPLPPDSLSLQVVSNISQHPFFKSLLDVSSRCKGSRMLFEYDFEYSRVLPYKMNSRLLYKSYFNPVYIECTTFPSHSFKDNCINCFVCFSTHNTNSFKLGIIEGLHYNVMMSPDNIVDGVLKVRECQEDLFRNASTPISFKPQATVHTFILGQDDPHFSMYFVNKVMGPHLKSDKEDIVNMEDNCIQHSAFGKEWNCLFLLR